MAADGDVLRRAIDETIALHERVKLLAAATLLEAAALIVEALGRGGTLLIFGNGGSAADAQHVAAELVGRFERERAAMAAVSLTADTSVLTSLANDYGFDRVFARQIEGIGRAGDVALGITTSGRSPSVVAALRSARERGIRTIAVTGRDGGAAGQVADVHVNVASDSTPRIQEVHRTLLHVLCELVERALFDRRLG